MLLSEALDAAAELHTSVASIVLLCLAACARPAESPEKVRGRKRDASSTS